MNSLAGTSCLWSPSPTLTIATLVSASISRALSRTAPARSIAASISSKTLGDDEDFLLADAEQVVVVRAALDDRAGGAVEVGRLVDDDRRIARPGDDRPACALAARPARRPGRR